MFRSSSQSFGLLILGIALSPSLALGAVTREEVEQAIRGGVSFLKSQQDPNTGAWPDADLRAHEGTSALATLALLTAGEPATEAHVAKALSHLEQFTATALGRTYSVALQTMVFSAADPVRYKVHIANNVAWLERAQIKPGDGNSWPGSWTYDDMKGSQGDNSNTQYALLGLHAASEAGIPVKPEVWVLSRQYWELAQRKAGFDTGAWGYFPNDHQPASASMSCAGISSLIITGLKRYQGTERLQGDRITHCGEGGINPDLQRAIDWLAANFKVGENHGKGQLWKYYYLYGLERAGRLTGQRFFGDHDWYREGAEHLIHDRGRDPLIGKWTNTEATERDATVTTSFVLLFLAKGRAPVLINKLRHGPGSDWNNDRDDVRNLTGLVSRDWNHLLTWQIVDPASARVEDLMQAPVVYFNGHQVPHFSAEARKNLREYVEQGGFILAEACCSSPEFNSGFRALMKDIFPDPEYDLHPLAEDHAIWRAKFRLTPDIHPLWGIEHGCRTVVVYTPEDLSCFWNQMETQPDNPSVVKAQRVGQNIIDYATGREMPADKLAVRDVTKFAKENPQPGALHIAKLRHAGDWNVAPLAIPNLTTMLRDKLKFDVVINHREIFPRDPNLVYYPLVYIHGRAALSFSPDDLAALRRHLEPGGGVLFADAACGSPAFDAAFRKFVSELLSDNPLVAIPPDDELYTQRTAFDLSDVQYSKAAGAGKGLPQLEGVKLNGHWAIIYSKYDVGCALERQQGLDCKGYTHESAMRIAANIVIYATLP
jgi:hypothetical protein